MFRLITMIAVKEIIIRLFFIFLLMMSCESSPQDNRQPFFHTDTISETCIIRYGPPYRMTSSDLDKIQKETEKAIEEGRQLIKLLLSKEDSLEKRPDSK